jgi:Flp pilus assembly protein TadD
LARSAQTAIKGGDTNLAERLLRRAATFAPEDAAIAAKLAFVLLKNDQAELAKRWANWSLSLEPELPEGFFVLRELALADGEQDEAKTYFQKVPDKSDFGRQAKDRLSQM